MYFRGWAYFREITVLFFMALCNMKLLEYTLHDHKFVSGPCSCAQVKFITTGMEIDMESLVQF